MSIRFNLPDQTGHSGEFLETNGINPFWAPIGISPVNIALPNTQILVGQPSNFAGAVPLTLASAGGAFSLANTGVLTMPNADTSTRGLLTAADWNTFNNKLSSALPSMHLFVGNSSNIAADGGTGILYDETFKSLTIDSTGGSAIPIVLISAGNTTFGVTSTAGQAILNLLPSGIFDSFVTYRTNLIFGTNGGLGGMITDLFSMDNAGNFTAGSVATSVSGTVSLVHGASGNLVQLNAYNGVGTTWQMYLPGDGGNPGDVLSTDGSGNTSWIAPGVSLPNVAIQAYGTTLDLSAGVSTYYDIQFSGSTGAATLLLPIGTNAPVGTELIIKDLGVSASTNNITVDAGTSNFVVGTTSAQTYVLNLDGECIKVRKVSATQWSIE